MYCVFLYVLICLSLSFGGSFFRWMFCSGVVLIRFDVCVPKNFSVFNLNDLILICFMSFKARFSLIFALN